MFSFHNKMSTYSLRLPEAIFSKGCKDGVFQRPKELALPSLVNWPFFLWFNFLYQNFYSHSNCSHFQPAVRKNTSLSSKYIRVWCSPISFTLPEDSNVGSSFLTLFIESSTSSLIWSIPTTCPLGPTWNKNTQLNKFC